MSLVLEQGVIKREPDTKWKLQPEHLERLKGVQADILHRYPRMLKNQEVRLFMPLVVFYPWKMVNQVQQFLKTTMHLN